MARYTRRRKTVRPFRAMRKARSYRARGLGAFGRAIGRYAGRKFKNAVHWFRKELSPNIFYEGGSDIHSVYFFQASTVGDWSDLADNYDQYLVKKIILTFEPQYNGSNTGAVGPYQRWMRVVHDYNDATALTSEQQYLNYSNCKSYLTSDSKVKRVTIYPRILQSTQNYPSGTSVSKIVKPGWISTSASDIPMYGVKFMIPTLGLTSGYAITRMRVTVVLGMKNIR